LPGRVETRIRSLPVEFGGGAHRHRLAQQDIGLRQGLGHAVDKRLVKQHQAATGGFAHHFLQQPDGGQRLGHDTVVEAIADMSAQGLQIGFEPGPVHHQPRRRQPRFL
jgi:hypothetical protein